MSWLLLALVAISLLSMPLTQHLWTWDRFLRGGQDFETGAFLILISFCLVMVLARACRSCLDQIFAALRAFVLSRARRDGSTFFPAVFSFLPGIGCTPSGVADNLPIQI